MNWAMHGSIKGESFSPPLQFPLPLSPPPPPPLFYENNFQNRISPSILLIIIILAVIFFISGLLHLLVRYLFRTTSREPEDLDNATVLQGQLQQLFHLHDAGVDQSFIDTLPVFLYKAIIGLKDPFDCAVCLCEFEGDDKLRLLPKCSHAFHLDCIDTWLLSHSTCPLCRSSLLPDYSPNNSCSPLVLVLQSGSESSREIASETWESGSNALLVLPGEEEFRPSSNETCQKPGEIAAKEEVGTGLANSEAPEAKVVHVKLGKFRSVEAGGGEGEGTSSGDTNLDQRRCFSMGSYEYVMDENSLLQVAIPPPKKKPASKKPRNRLAMSECDYHSRREGFKGFDSSRIPKAKTDTASANLTSTSLQKESFSISKIWLRSNKDKPIAGDSSRRASSFRLPLQMSSTSPVTVSDYNVSGWEKSGSEVDWDLEVGSCNNSLSSRADEAPSFARRTLLWIVGRQRAENNH
ncbi:RING-H2 finger protein ATL13-like [Typha angustifolia]|uniref:RING-H2 finger protein ATL13-like n=1 Tax=Typha angustifolia TaxID=59011 RepID=UPI003C2FCB9A